MKPTTTVIIIVLAFLLSGCGIFQTKKPEERIVYQVIRVPTEMTVPVIITAPARPEIYSTMGWNKQEEHLMWLIQEHMQQIGTCNSRLQAIGAWNLRQLKIYEPTSPLLKTAIAP